jgi:hypothetical protein
MLPLSVTTQRLKPIARRNAKINQSGGSIQHRQLPHSNRFGCDKATNSLAFKKTSSERTPEGNNRDSPYSNDFQ